MVEDIPPPDQEQSGEHGDGERGEDILGKLDQLLHRHRPKPPEADASLPVLSDALQLEPESPPEDPIPTLMDIVGKSARPASFRKPATRADPALETRILYRLAAALEVEGTRIASAGGDPARIRQIELLIAELRRALPAIVRSALSGD